MASTAVPQCRCCEKKNRPNRWVRAIQITHLVILLAREMVDLC